MTPIIVDLDLPPRKGWSLAKLFVEHIWDKHQIDSETFDASGYLYRVATDRHSFHDVVDFQQRLSDLTAAQGAPQIELIYEEPELLSDERLTSDVMRVLRTIDNGKKYIEEDTRSLLSTSCIVDVIKQLYLRVQRQAAPAAQAPAP